MNDAIFAGQQRILELIARGAHPREVLSAIAVLAERSVPDLLASILIFDRQSGTLRSGGRGKLAASFADIIDGLEPGPVTGSCGTAAFRRKRVITPDVANDPLWAPFLPVAQQYGIAGAWSTPLIDAENGSLLGVFGMYYPTPRTPTDDELKVADHFAHLATVALLRDRLDERQRYQVMHDPITDLGNRRFLRDQLSHSRSTSQINKPATVVLFDFEQARRNDQRFGRLLGDRRLVEIGFRLQNLLPDATLARLEGDHFVAVVHQPDEEALAVIESTVGAFTLPVSLPGVDIRQSLAVGAVPLHVGLTDIDEILYHATEATRRSKEMGGGRVVVFDEGERAASVERRRIESLLIGLLAENRVVPHFQPIVNLATGRPVAFEALARLHGPDVADISPGVFIPIAEESHLIDAIGMSILRASCKAMADNPTAFGDVVINVNVSVRQLMSPSFPFDAVSIARKFCIEPRQICFEITESQWLDRNSPARGAMLALRRDGFGLALDDFGTGYASLSYLQELPFSSVKNDGSFIRRLGTSTAAAAMCEAALSMAHACGMSITAECVETEEQATILREMGYQFAQGYLFGRPMPLAAAIEWLSERDRRTADARA